MLVFLLLLVVKMTTGQSLPPIPEPTLPAIERVEKRSHAQTALDVATGLCQGTPTRGEIEARGAPGLAAATEAVAEALERRFGSGPIEGGLSAFVVSAER